MLDQIPSFPDFSFLSDYSTPGSMVLSEADASVPVFSEEDQRLLNHINEVILQNVGNPDFTILELSTAVSISERQLRRNLKKLLQMRPWQYVRFIRLQQANYLLRKKKFKTISQLAYAVGYRDPTTFRCLFEQHFSVSIKDFLG